MTQKTKFAWWKLIAIWVGFLLLHFSYGAFPGPFFQIVAEDHEATFFHMKMLFFAYLVVSLVEFLVRRKKIKSAETFIYSRALIAVVYPWITITMWFTAEALGIRIPLMPWEIIYANILTVIGIYMALRLEEIFEDTKFRPALKGMIIILFITAMLSYISFSINVPVHFFTTPPE
jgi:hypothetical protein